MGSIVGGLLILSRRLERSNPIPFGPYLALTMWISLLWGESLLNAYLQMAGL